MGTTGRCAAEVGDGRRLCHRDVCGPRQGIAAPGTTGRHRNGVTACCGVSMARVLQRRGGTISEGPVPAAGRPAAGKVTEDHRQRMGTTGRCAAEVGDGRRFCHRDVSGPRQGIAAPGSRHRQLDIISPGNGIGVARVLQRRDGTISEGPAPATGRPAAGQVAEDHRQRMGTTGRCAAEVGDRSRLCHRDVSGPRQGIAAPGTTGRHRHGVTAGGAVGVARILQRRGGAISEGPAPAAGRPATGQVAEGHRQRMGSTGRCTAEVGDRCSRIDGDHDAAGIGSTGSCHQQYRGEATVTRILVRRILKGRGSTIAEGPLPAIDATTAGIGEGDTEGCHSRRDGGSETGNGRWCR